MDLPPSAFTRPPPPCAPPRPLRPSLLGVGDHARTRGRSEGRGAAGGTGRRLRPLLRSPLLLFVEDWLGFSHLFGQGGRKKTLKVCA